MTDLTHLKPITPEEIREVLRLVEFITDVKVEFPTCSTDLKASHFRGEFTKAFAARYVEDVNQLRKRGEQAIDPFITHVN